MTISFNCPHCDNFCAVRDQHAGKEATCQKCWKLLIIPSEDRGKAVKVVTPENDTFDGPVSGFYRAATIENLKQFLQPGIIPKRIFVVTAVLVRFFTAHKNYILSVYIQATGKNAELPLPFGHVISALVWGCLFWFYMQSVYSTAFESDITADVEMEGGFDFFVNIFKSLYVFGLAFIILLLPAGIVVAVNKHTSLDLSLLAGVLGVAGIFFLPISILTVSVGRDVFMLCRFDYMIKPVAKATKQYLVVAVPVMVILLVQWNIKQYGPLRESGGFAIGLHLSANIAVQILALLTGRALGLFYRHYSCYLPW